MSGHAEIDEVWPRDGRLRLVGRLHGPPPGHAARGALGRLRTRTAEAREWSVQFVLREDRGRPWRLRYPARLDGARFDVTLPVADLAPEALRLPARWDVWLADGSARLRAGRFLDGVTGKKEIMVFPGQSVSRTDTAVLVRPYYTVKDNLSVEVRPKR
ncbi:hypothetical protein [Streptomyces avicenniae]|uniref:hypothetical protein n=1 Tax=Streptomyces avicenniae TaxID=500153 RepID=UPI000699E8EB|nr:hypothetical protein [Streptomyces avicenniae]